MNASKPARPLDVDPVIAAFDDARPLDEPLDLDDISAIEAAMAEPGPGITSAELLERLRPKT